MNWNHSIPQPPVPQGIREALKDYPELIRVVQDDLNWKVDKMLQGAHFPPFEEVVWTLEATFDNFIIDAVADEKVAEASGDVDAIERTKSVGLLLGRTGSAHYWHTEDGEGSLWNYFQIHRKAFE